jgi:hypothetical protein
VWKRKAFKLPTGKTAWKNGLAVYDQSAASASRRNGRRRRPTLFVLGFFYETVANTRRPTR